jgi:hypothetical protein
VTIYPDGASSRDCRAEKRRNIVVVVGVEKRREKKKEERRKESATAPRASCPLHSSTHCGVRARKKAAPQDAARLSREVG